MTVCTFVQISRSLGIRVGNGTIAVNQGDITKQAVGENFVLENFI